MKLRRQTEIIVKPDGTGVADNQSSWIGDTFKKRECIKFQPDRKNIHKCLCGKFLSSHQNANEEIPEDTDRHGDEKNLSISISTELSPTDAFGTIEFQGGPYPTKAQYVRLAFDTKPEKIFHLLLHHWGLDFPKLIISVHGGIANFDLQPKLRNVCKQGLFNAAKTMGTWVLTGGTNTGVIKHVGESLGDTLVQSRHHIVTIGIAPWGVLHNREELIGKNNCVPYFAVSQPTSENIVLNSSHSYFLLADDGSVGKFGCEMILRKNLEKHISQMKHSENKSSKDHGTPVVCLLMEGGSNCIRTVLECVTDKPPIPVVIIDGSGRASDLLAFVHKHAQSDGTISEMMKTQLTSMIACKFNYGSVTCEKVFTELMLCMKQKKRITVFRTGKDTQDFDQAILNALLKNQKSSLSSQLNLTMSWNRADIARNHLFLYGQDWPEGALDSAMFEALVNNNIEFVQLLIENGVEMKEWLTVKRLEDLYNQVLSTSRPTQAKYLHKSGNRTKLDSTGTLRHLLAEHKGTVPANYRFTLYDIGQVINKMMGGGFQSIYGRRKFQMLHNAAKKKSRKISATSMISSSSAFPTTDEYNQLQSSGFKYPYSELLVWAVLLRRQKTAMFMWERGEETMAKCLVAAKLYKGMAREAKEDEYEIDVANEIKKYYKEFSDIATELLEQCFKTNWDLTQMLLTYELTNWSNQTCLSLAVAGSNKSFLAHTCCQLLLTEMWMGGLRTRKYPSLKVIFGLVFFPSIPCFKYRSKEELEMMPQTQENHEDDRDSNASESDSSDTENAVILQTMIQQQQQLQQLSNIDAKNMSIKPTTTSVAAVAALAAVGAMSSPANDGHTTAASLQQQRYQKRRFSKQLKTDASKKRRGSKPNLGDTTVPKEVIASINSPKNRSQLHFASKIVKFYTAPITKFWLNVIGYWIFLLLYVYMIIQSTPNDKPSNIEWYIVACMIGLTLEKIREFLTCDAPEVKQRLIIFFSDIWNLFDIAAICFFFIGFTIRFTPSLVSSARPFYCLTIMICIIKLTEFYVVSPKLGPFGPMISNMIKESTNVVAYVFVLVLSFGTFRQGLWYPDYDFEWLSVKEIFHKPYIMLYGELYSDIIWPDCVDNVTSADDFKCVPGRWLMPAVYSVFLAIGYVVLFNIIVALFNRICMQSNLQFDITWKFQRYNLVIKYVGKPFLPSPFIIICHAVMLVRFLTHRCVNKKKVFDRGLKIFLHEKDLEKLHYFEEECMEGYQSTKSQQAITTNEYSIEQTSERLEKNSIRLDHVHQNETSIRHRLQKLEMQLDKIKDTALTSTTSFQSQQMLIQMHQMLQSLPINTTSSEIVPSSEKKQQPDSSKESKNLLSHIQVPTIFASAVSQRKLRQRAKSTYAAVSIDHINNANNDNDCNNNNNNNNNNRNKNNNENDINNNDSNSENYRHERDKNENFKSKEIVKTESEKNFAHPTSLSNDHAIIMQIMQKQLSYILSYVQKNENRGDRIHNESHPSSALHSLPSQQRFSRLELSNSDQLKKKINWMKSSQSDLDLKLISKRRDHTNSHTSSVHQGSSIPDSSSQRKFSNSSMVSAFSNSSINRKHKKVKMKRDRHRKISTTSIGIKTSRVKNLLKQAEEHINEQMKTIVKRRIQEMKLAKQDDKFANLAKYALKTIEYPNVEDEDDDSSECDDSQSDVGSFYKSERKNNEDIGLKNDSLDIYNVPDKFSTLSEKTAEYQSENSPKIRLKNNVCTDDIPNLIEDETAKIDHFASGTGGTSNISLSNISDRTSIFSISSTKALIVNKFAGVIKEKNFRIKNKTQGSSEV